MYSSSLNPSIDVYRGEDNEEKVAPCLIVAAQNATEVVLNTGNYRVGLTITTKQIASDTDVDDNDTTIASSAYDLLADNQETLVNYITGLYIDDVQVTGQSLDRDGDCWNQKLEIDIICRQTT